ncbi:uncharacterized protein SPAPADRAFT_132435 [Spathaspora passalidarum NRRL Y-27907]|uniref:Septin-type G domain-containing protein n=1 Tax=Spathaspora passalidarum (strain NRRL Y-27907 / 11-Y1) TaxID=619300 RepID=G3AF52_SPAPN|nr:uncharacterized protein SPAPADRAFT_132435 [Spathaspora passalidarum NRRL Y-27907]EGW34841.1 hypothetical protein SPAPADRAFT_132435 [Spathaspora passalidarum NRRL Y-27907]
MDQSYTFNVSSSNGQHSSPIINYRKDAKKGVKFTFMVVGESGTGKTTFINALLNKKVLNHRYESTAHTAGETKTLAFTSAKSVALPNTSILTRNEFNARTIHEEPGIALTETQIEILDDDNMKLFLNIIDTPGFGENLNNEICFVEIENYLKQQFDLVLAEETRIKRNPRFVDTRVHVMLYFITPTGHGLREIDIQCMKRLSKYVNIIPVIGKADSFTSDELQFFKQQIRIDIEKFNIPTFQFDSFLNEYDEEEDYDLIQESKFLASLQPFAVVCSEDTFEVSDGAGGKPKIVTARQYPWGLVDINDTRYSDFSILRSVLLGSHLQDLKDLTHDFLYETYRTERLTKVTGDAGFDDDLTEQPTETHDHTLGTRHEIPSLSNLAQLTDSSTNGDFAREIADSHSITSTSSSLKKPSMLLDDEVTPQSPRLRNVNSFTSSSSTVSFDTEKQQNNNQFKRLSIGPQRNQLRQLSETVPYVIRHERNLERQAKLEEMEMASAKELAHRAAMLERKAAELKAKERELMRQLEEAREIERKKEQAERQRAEAERQREEAERIKQAEAERVEEEDEQEDPEPNVIEVHDESYEDSQEHHIEKDTTITDLHSIVSQH